MKRSMFMLAILLTIPCLYLFRTSAVRAETIYFDDSDPNLMVVGNGAYYEIGLRKSNGSIAYLTDKSTGQRMMLGSRYECLWGASFSHATPNYVGGCSYHAAGANRFSYAWSAATNTLTLNYVPDPAASQTVTAQVTMRASQDAWLDLRLQLQNNWGSVLDYILFPSDLVFREADIGQALLPILPGIVLEPAFFAQHRSYTANYPGYPGLFADYGAVVSPKGQLAIYSLAEPGTIHPTTIGFIHDDAYVSDSTYYYHTFGARVSDGNAWTSPGVRLRVSQSPLETIRAYRVDNGLDQFRSLEQKLGSRYTQLVQSPLFKADTVQLGIPFSQYASILSRLPSPGILHPVAFQPGGHDENYPDFLPPAPTWGTTADFAAMFRQAQALGLLVMPYTNPTWWDDQSPTLQNLPAPLALKDVAVLNEQGVPRYESYGAHGGYVMSPYAPFVQQRLNQLVQQMTVNVPSNLLFEDQIGARPWLFDHNAASPLPAAYPEGWLEHTRTYSPTLLMTELGFDRLAETEVGFQGSVLLPERSGETSSWWGTGTWHPYPLAPLMTRDKVLFYQHDLAPETMTVDKATLTWNLAYGYMLSYDLPTGGLDNPWLELVGAFQKYVLARYAGERITDFTNLDAQVTQTSFETFTVIANWDPINPYSTHGHTLPPHGVLSQSTNGMLTAGIFTAYNRAPLSPGDHYLIEAHGLNDLTVRQPIGADTSLTLKLPSGWNASASIQAWAYTKAGQVIERVPLTVTAQDMTFTYQQQRSGQPVGYYRVLNTSLTPPQIFLPLLLK